MSSVIMVSAVYTTKLEKGWLYGALASLAEKEALLCTNVFDADTKKPYHRILDQIDLDKIVFYRPEIETFQELNDVLIPKVKLEYQDESIPLWRAYIIGKEQRELVWVYDHSIADGSSGVLFHQQLLECLNRDDLNLGQTIVKCKSSDIAPKMEDTMDIRPSWGYLFKYKYDGWKHMLSLDPKTWVGDPPAVPMSSQTKCFELTPAEARNLVQYCRKRKFTITSLLYAALIKKIAELWVENPESYSHLVFTCPVNARRYIKVQPMENRIGNYVFQYYEDFPLTDRDMSIDNLAARYNENLKKAIDDPTEIGQNVGMFNYKNIKQYLLDSCKTAHRGDTAEISNLGAFEFSSGKNTTIEKLNFTQGVSSVGAYVTMNVIGVKNGTINGSISVACDDENFTRSTQLTNELLNSIRSLIN